MSCACKHWLVGSLTKKEVQLIVPAGTFHHILTRQSWDNILDYMENLAEDIINLVRTAAYEKVKKSSDVLDGEERIHHEYPIFMKLPTKDEQRASYRAFREATSNDALLQCVCVVCGRELWATEGSEQVLLDIPNIQTHLKADTPNASQDSWNGMLLACEFLKGDGEGTRGWVCNECSRALQGDSTPKLSLANNLWIGKIPHELAILTLPEQLLISRHYPRCYIVKLYPCDGYVGNSDHLQRGSLAGNVTLYNMNTDTIVDMLEEQLLPQRSTDLASVLAVTYVGSKKLPRSWLKSMFCIRHCIVYEALLWLKTNNVMFRDIEISLERLHDLPEDDMPFEISATIHQEVDDNIVIKEHEGYVPPDNQNGDHFIHSR
ncbi:hypothetical protein HD554DRAFT_2274986 [Boletus coccyginus]|nr:hypothetical protein HD554DRAFT_2274986 [Boletus coccyginus]